MLRECPLSGGITTIQRQPIRARNIIIAIKNSGAGNLPLNALLESFRKFYQSTRTVLLGKISVRGVFDIFSVNFSRLRLYMRS